MNRDLGAGLLGSHLNPTTCELPGTLPKLSIPRLLIGIEGEIVASPLTLGIGLNELIFVKHLEHMSIVIQMARDTGTNEVR